jgi:pyruvate,water dikinase
LTLAEKKISQKMKQIVLKERGVEEEDVPPDKQSVACLTDEEALRIAELAKSIELHYGSPQDIEWAVDRDFPFPSNTFLVQARPVTAIVKKKTSEVILESMLRRLLPQRPPA